MRVEILDDPANRPAPLSFPPGENHLDLRQNPRAVDRIAPARAHLPLRNFLAAVNGSESVFSSASAGTECKPVRAASEGETFEFSSRVTLVFAVPSINFDRNHFTELAASLKELLERDSAESIRGELRVFECEFPEQGCSGFSLGIQLTAQGDSARQAEVRWGLGLARVQQALLFRSRALGQQIGA